MKKNSLMRFDKKRIKCLVCFTMECRLLILKKTLNDATWVSKWRNLWLIIRKARICSILLLLWVIWNMQLVKSTTDKTILIIRLTQEQSTNDSISLRLKNALKRTLIAKMLELWDDGGLRSWSRGSLDEQRED